MYVHPPCPSTTQDEYDVDEGAYDAIRPRTAKLREEMRQHLADNNRGEVIRTGIRVAIVGPPNAGKSTLLNLLARRPAAIVSPIAGTTRCVGRSDQPESRLVSWIVG
jgi:tRNA modification GTPase